MSADHFDVAIEAMPARRPFQAFTIELNSGKRFEIDHFSALMFSVGMAVYTLPGGIQVLFDANCVSHIIDAPASDVPNGSH